MNLAVKEMPNFVGTIATPRFFHRLWKLNCSTSFWVFKKSHEDFSSFQSRCRVQFWICWPKCSTDPSLKKFISWLKSHFKKVINKCNHRYKSPLPRQTHSTIYLHKQWLTLISSGLLLSSMAILWIQFSVISIPWGPPNPRKAVLLGKLVKQTLPFILTFGIS